MIIDVWDDTNHRTLRYQEQKENTPNMGCPYPRTSGSYYRHATNFTDQKTRLGLRIMYHASPAGCGLRSTMANFVRIRCGKGL